jgi:tRNA (guanine-N7-)-methyltransferase
VGRLRSIPHADSIIKTSKYLLNCDEVKQITCTHLEIGCGKGDFIISKASQESKNSFIGVEKYATVLLKAIRKLDKIPTHLKNIKFIHNDFSEI